jgi:hypothetical protein
VFAWLKKKTPEERETEALDKMLSEFRNESGYINENWLPDIRQRYNGKIADVWRDYLASLAAKCEEHDVDTLAQLSADARIVIGNVLAEEMIARHKLCRKLRTKTEPTPEYLDAMIAMYAYKHVGSFVTAMSTERYGIAGEYAGQLDAYLAAASGESTKFSDFLKGQRRG